MDCSVFDKWLSDLRFMLANLPDALVYSVLTVGTFLFAVSFCVSAQNTRSAIHASGRRS